jgi:outer membrane protein OmpA-like peptidoglycan-associated protein
VPAIDLDSDEDGIKDSVDKCKFEPEDKDQFEDSDGCIDKDNDGDKLADADDKCPMEAEDFDEFEDTDGCVDKDNDRDGVLDTADKCKGYPEDKDGFEDADGCPELDNDKDGLPDKTDQCLNDPETINGNKDDDGCPDNGDSLVILSPDRIELMESIKFDGASTKLSKGTFNVLGQVAATLRAHPEIIRMRVTVHVHDNGDGADPKDQELSDKRAQVIRDWIVQWGIAASRVEARGFGATKMQGKTRALNDRVELIILERK